MGTTRHRHRRTPFTAKLAVLALAAGLLPATVAGIELAAAPTAQAQSSSGSGTDDCTDVPASGAPVDSFVLPGWSDGSGWSAPAQYESIMNGDVTGDGIAELVANNGGELEVYTWAPNFNRSSLLTPPADPTRAYDPNPGQWTPIQPAGTTPTFATTDGWSDPARYETFQLGDVLGLGYHQVVVRGADGITVYRWDPTTNGFGAAGSANPPVTGPPWSDANGWGQTHPERYRTIMVGDVRGGDGGREELVANGPDGMEVWSWNGAAFDRLDQPAANEVGDFTDPSSYETFRLGRFFGANKDQLQLIVRDPGVGLLLYDFGLGDGGVGPAFIEWPVPGSNDWTDGNGWANASSYETISVGDVNGDGVDDVVGRSQDGVDTWTYDFAGGVFTRLSPQPTLASPTLISNAAGYTDVSTWGTFQLGNVLPDPGATPVMELLVRADAGMATYQLTGGQWAPATDAGGNPLVAGFFANTTVVNGATQPTGWDDSVTNGTAPAPDWRSSTIRATTVVEGEPQYLRGRDALGIRMLRPDGTFTSAPFPTWTDLQGVPTVLPSQPDTSVPYDPTPAQQAEIGKLTPEGRSYWHINAVAMTDIWPNSSPDNTVLDEFVVADDTTKLGTLQSDLTNALSAQRAEGAAGNDGTSLDTFNPGNAELQALNVPRSTFMAVQQDVADWTGAAIGVNDYFLGPQGQQQLVLLAYVSNTGQVTTIENAFDTGSGKWFAFLADMLWGLIGSMSGVNEFIPKGFVGLSDKGVATLKAAITVGANMAGAGQAAGQVFDPSPRASLDTDAATFESDLRQNFCSTRITLGQNYDQIVQDYGLLVATETLIDRTPISATDFQTMVNTQSNQLSVWIWQQFANLPDRSGNWWVGWCEGASGCPWKAGDKYVYTTPENADITYRIVGESDSGKKANCSFDQLAQSRNSAFVGLNVDPATWASPRKTTDTGSPGHPLPDANGRIGVNGWSLGVQKCN